MGEQVEGRGAVGGARGKTAVDMIRVEEQGGRMEQEVRIDPGLTGGSYNQTEMRLSWFWSVDRPSTSN